MPPYIRSLEFNDASIDELFEHGLDPDDAYAVLSGNPKLVPNKRRRERRRMNRPQRWKMIGAGRTGKLLTIIIEDPDDAGRAHVVTGWVSSGDERTRFRQPGGRSNRP